MENRRSLNTVLSDTSKAEILARSRSTFFQHFEPLVEDCCMRMDFEFGVQLGKNREKFTNDQYVKLLEYLRSIRRNLKQDYLHQINALFDDFYRPSGQHGSTHKPGSTATTLADNELVKENHAINQIVRQCEHLFFEELTSLNRYFPVQRNKQTVIDQQNPIYPEKLVRALSLVVQPLKVNADVRIALYKAFDVAVFSRLGFIYRELYKWCEQTAQTVNVEEPEEQTVTRASVTPIVHDKEQPGTEFLQLQQQLSLWQLTQPANFGIHHAAINGNHYEYEEIIHALQALHRNNQTTSFQGAGQLKQEMLKKLHEFSLTVEHRILAKHDNDVLDLVGLLFTIVARDKRIPDSLKMGLLSLEIALTAVSLRCYQIFTGTDHPVRMLLNDLYSMAVYLDIAEAEELLIQERILKVVKRLNRDIGDSSAWIAEAEPFSIFVEQQKKHAKEAELSALQVIRNQHSVSSPFQQQIVDAIERSISGKTLPITIIDFLRNIWFLVLLDALEHKDEHPGDWDIAIRTMDDLILSVIPPVDDLARKQLLKLLPGLIAALRSGLKRISYEKSAQSRFFKELAVWHIILMDKKEKAADQAKMHTIVDTDVLTGNSDNDDAIVNSLKPGIWVCFCSANKNVWGKLLSANSDQNQPLLFVKKCGAKLLEIQVKSFIERLHSGQVFMDRQSSRSLMEQVFDELAMHE